MSIKEIFSQDKAISILQKAHVAGKSPHAYIFAGPDGVGRFKTARQWAKMLLCQNPVTENNFADSCGSCRSCTLLEADSHPDFSHIYKELVQFTRDGKERKTPVDLPIDVIREFLVEKISAKPALSEKKVFVITEAERLNASSQNAMLKVLEEPPQYCCIILLCTRLEKLLPTVKSRARIVRFGSVGEDKIIEKLKQMGLDSQKARYFACLARGSLGQACQWAQLEMADANLYQIKKDTLARLCSLQYAESLELAQWLLDQSKQIADVWANLQKTTSKTDINRRAHKTILLIIISALHDAMKLNLTKTQKITNSDQKQLIQNLACRFEPQNAAEKIADCYQSLRWIESNVNEKLIFEHLLLNLAVSDTMKV